MTVHVCGGSPGFLDKLEMMGIVDCAIRKDNPYTPITPSTAEGSRRSRTNN